MIDYLSVCSGIEAVSVAWAGLDMRPVGFSEVSAFPCAVLRHRQSAVDASESDASSRGIPLWGDFTALRVRHMLRLGWGCPDILVGGTPCQAFSVAGLRKSMDDARGNLTLHFVRLANAIDNFRRHQRGIGGITILWENVPGVLSTNDNAFGCFLGALVGAVAPLVPSGGQRWTDAGVVAGPQRVAAWRILDAQHFGLAQRRRRVFVVAGPRDGLNPAAVLFEQAGVRGDSPSGGEARAGVAGTLGASTQGRGWRAGDDESGGGHIVAHTLKGTGHDGSEDGTGRGVPLVIHPLLSGGNDRHDDTLQTYVASTLRANTGRHQVESTYVPDISPALKARDRKGPSSDGDGDGDGAPLVPVAFHATQDPNRATVSPALGATAILQAVDKPAASVVGVGHDGDPAYTMTSTERHGVAVFDAAQITSRGNRATVAPGQPAPTMQATSRMGVVGHGVRRLTPRECERLQGFPDDYTAIPYRGREASDGARQEALGNSMAVPVIRWIGQRILDVNNRAKRHP